MGIPLGRRPELVGDGLIRSLGGWGGKGLHNRKRQAKGSGSSQGLTLLLDCS